jgi:hypothetical protein
MWRLAIEISTLAVSSNNRRTHFGALRVRVGLPLRLPDRERLDRILPHTI